MCTNDILMQQDAEIILIFNKFDTNYPSLWYRVSCNWTPSMFIKITKIQVKEK